MIAVQSPVLLPMPEPEIIETAEGAEECDHQWRRRPSMWSYSRTGSAGYGLGLLFWLVLAVRTGLSLARAASARARVVSLVLAIAAMVLVAGADIWYLVDLKSTVEECRGLDVLTPPDLYDWRVLKAALTWHIAATLICFGGGAVWFGWLMRLPEPDDYD